MRASVVTAALLLWAATPGSSGAPWAPDHFPNPQTEPRKCGRHTVGRSWICDPDGLLPVRSQNIIEGTLKAIAAAEEPYAKANTDCGGARSSPGYQVAVALANAIDVSPGSDAGAAAQAFAARLMDAWGVGEAACNDGAVLLLSQQPRQVAIYAGAGVKDRLDAKRIGGIIGAMRPLLRAGKFDEALEGAVVDIGIALAGGPEDRGSFWGFLAALLFFGLFFTVLITSCLQSHRRNRQVRACQGLLAKLKREQALARASRQYPATSCPVCLEDFVPPLQPDPEAAAHAGPAAPKLADAAPSAPPLPGTEGLREEREGTGRTEDADLKASLLGGAAARRAAAASSSAGPPEEEEGARSCKPLVLPCGHSFCESCLGRWVKDHNTCPICRKPLTGDDPQPPPPPPVQQQQPCTRTGVWTTDSIETELLFRLNSLQRLYPYIVGADVLAAWTHQVRNGALLDWPEIRAEQLSGQTREQRAASGAFGSFGSFGGGSSTGGGGASGGW